MLTAWAATKGKQLLNIIVKRNCLTHLLTVRPGGSQSASLVLGLMPARLKIDRRLSAGESLVNCCGYCYLMGKCLSPVCMNTHNPIAEEFGFEETSPFSDGFRCQFKSLRVKHSVPFGANVNLLKVSGVRPPGAIVNELCLPWVISTVRRFTYEPG